MNSSPPPSVILPWIAFVLAVVSVFFTGFAAWTGREKLRLDLYNRRFDIYSRTLDFYHVFLVWNPSEKEKRTTSLCDSPTLDATQRAFIKASRESQFLFKDREITKLLEQMHKDSIKIIGYKRDTSLFATPQLVPLVEETGACWKRINETMPFLEKRMAQYLDFHRI